MNHLNLYIYIILIITLLGEHTSLLSITPIRKHSPSSFPPRLQSLKLSSSSSPPSPPSYPSTNLVIVESPAKAATISTILNALPGSSKWIVRSCNGHIVDLPTGGGKENSLGVDVENNYEVSAGAKRQRKQNHYTNQHYN